MMMDYTNDLVSAVNDIIIDTKWQKIGRIDKLMTKGRVKLYPDINDDDNLVQLDDIVVFCLEGNTFHAMDCACPHEGGPLDMGDIEDMGSNGLSVICPWHSYDFNLNDGTSSTGLKTNVYDTQVSDGILYIKCDHLISLVKPCDQTKTNDIATDDVLVPIQAQIIKEENENTLCKQAFTILNTDDPMVKAELTRRYYKDWKLKEIPIGSYRMPDEPKRQEGLVIKDPGRIKIGRGGTLESRIAIIHSLANIEQWAVDLSWDIIGRFSLFKINNEELPVQFFADFLKVADDEAKHFTMLNERLEELGSSFGALPVHNGLWQSADETSHDLLARLAIVHMVHEARGLDVHPKTNQRFAAQKDKQSVAIMDVIYEDEITHVACGMKWFTYVCQNMVPPLNPVSTFHKLVKKHFKGYLKPPFNTDARLIAGMTEENMVRYAEETMGSFKFFCMVSVFLSLIKLVVVLQMAANKILDKNES